INLGGTLQGLAVDITAMQGPTLIPDGWTELTLNAPGSEINEWNGTAYVPIEQTLSSIQARATLDVLGGRDYTTANALAIGSGALLNLEAGTIATGGLTVDAGGLVKGTATIGGVITDNGTLSASGAGLVLSGTVNGTGNLTFDPAGGTLEVANVGSSVTVTMHGNDTLKLDNPATFLGTIAAQIGDSILLQGLTATSAVLNSGTLVVSNGTTVVDSLALAGTYTGDSFTVDSSGGAARITIGVPPATTYTWASGKDGDWNTAANWGPATIPNGGGAAVVIDAAPVGTNGYTVTIANGASDMVQSLTLNPTNNLLGVLATPYNAAALEVDGTLTFAPGTDGTLGGPLQNLLVMNNGTIVNAGTVNAFIQGVGNDLFTGTNGIYVTNWLQALGTVTIDTKTIAEMTGTTLFDGIFEAKGPGATINLGGTLQGLAVDITAMQGPTLIPDGWTELTLNAPGSEINEWNGTAYVPIEQTLSSIQARATLDVLGGRDYTTANALAIGSGALLN